MKKWLIRKLLEMLGHKPTKNICISITADASHALDAISRVKKELEQVSNLQNEVNLRFDVKK
jgi:hypothetical protein